MKSFLLFLTTALMANTVPNVGNVPVLLELFTSEGCSSCPPADQLLQTLDRDQPVAGANLIVLSEHVDYWNHLGWSDPYSSAKFTARQQEYSRRLHTDEVYTPQLVIDGRSELVGSNRGKVTAAIGGVLRETKLPIEITASRTGNIAKVHLSGFVAPPYADLYLAAASDHAQSQVARGENAGRALSHVAVAYSLEKFPAKAGDLEVSLHAGGSRVIAFLQDRQTGHILAIAQAHV